MYVKCQGGCVSLFPRETYDFSPPDGDLEQLDSRSEDGTKAGGEGGTLEGSEARASEKRVKELPF